MRREELWAEIDEILAQELKRLIRHARLEAGSLCKWRADNATVPVEHCRALRRELKAKLLGEEQG